VRRQITSEMRLETNLLDGFVDAFDGSSQHFT
jgi:hypothetical protein